MNVKSNNSKEIRFYAHAIKGAAKNVGAKRLSDTAYQLEYAAVENNVEMLEPFFDRLKSELEKVIAFLSQTDWIEIAKNEKVITDEKLNTHIGG